MIGIVGYTFVNTKIWGDIKCIVSFILKNLYDLISDLGECET